MHSHLHSYLSYSEKNLPLTPAIHWVFGCTPCRHTTEKADFKVRIPVSLSCEILSVAMLKSSGIIKEYDEWLKRKEKMSYAAYYFFIPRIGRH
jgi:hypothetical protein